MNPRPLSINFDSLLILGLMFILGAVIAGKDGSPPRHQEKIPFS
jgi:hypothetical protein